jgi:arsenate reductase (glutaredoxin)
MQSTTRSVISFTMLRPDAWPPRHADERPRQAKSVFEMTESKVEVTIYHNPSCGTSRNTLQLIRDAGIEPTVIEYLKSPPDRATIKSLITRMGITARELLRQKGTPYVELGLDAGHWAEVELIDQMLEHPILINRPIVVTPTGARLCRPPEKVLEILPSAGTGAGASRPGQK